MSRLHHGLFVAAAPLVGMVLARAGRGIPGAIVGVLLLLLGIPWLLHCVQRPLVGENNIFHATREHLYFTNPYQDYEASFLAGRDILQQQGVTQIGLITNNFSFEYPWWVFLREDNPSVRIEHVNVADPSGRLMTNEPFRGFEPEAVLTLDQVEQPDSLDVEGRHFRRHWSQDAVAIYLPE